MESLDRRCDFRVKLALVKNDILPLISGVPVPRVERAKDGILMRTLKVIEVGQHFIYRSTLAPHIRGQAKKLGIKVAIHSAGHGVVRVWRIA